LIFFFIENRIFRILTQKKDQPVIFFSAVLDPSSSSSSSSCTGSKKGGKGSKQSKRKAPDELWNEGNTPERLNPIDLYLVDSPPKSSTLTDPSVDVLCLLRYVIPWTNFS
jgi:hypothetical protein